MSADENRLTNLRAFFARYVAATGQVRDGRIEQAFAAVPREPFAGPGPWSICVPGVGYVLTPNDDPAFLYQDTLVALDARRGLNIGQPSAHARWLDALELREGETVVQVGAGVGYYSALLARLVGPNGQVHAFEIDPDFAQRARHNLQGQPWVTVHARSGIGDDLPSSDAVYVNAGITQPSWSWLAALRPKGRLMMPLHAMGAMGGMLLISRAERGVWPARFVSEAAFVACTGPQDTEAGRRLQAAFAHGGADTVRSFRTDHAIDATCWFKGDGWWLSSAAPEAAREEP
jgi:protein-L-isoaspartate(D-aspartate) O-methyltransferase